MLFDDDHSGLVDYNEFLRHIFPDQYVEYIQDKQQEDEEMRSSSKRVSEAIQRWEQVRNSVFSNGSKHQ